LPVKFNFCRKKSATNVEEKQYWLNVSIIFNHQNVKPVADLKKKENWINLTKEMHTKQ